MEIDAEARSHQSQFRETISKAIQDAFTKAAAQVKNAAGNPVRVEIERRVDYESFRLDPNSDAVLKAAGVVRLVTAMEPELAITDGGVDANWLFQHGVPAVTLGCGQRNVHTDQETLDDPIT